MIRVFFASLGIALFIGLIFSPAAIVPAFVILFVLIVVANLGKLKCPHCGKRVKLGKNVCHHCGREVKSLAARVATAAQSRTYPVSVQLPQPEQGTVKYCSNCGAMLGAGARFCSRCGGSVPQSLGGHAGAAN